MNLRLKNLKKKLNKNNEQGAALTTVIFFSVIVLALLLSFLLHERLFLLNILKEPSILQATFNARSGIYKALYKLTDTLFTDTLPPLSALDSALGSDLFTEGIEDSMIAKGEEKPQPDGEAVTYRLFEDDSISESKVEMKTNGGFCRLCAIGKYREREKRVCAKLGSMPPALYDTVVVYTNELKWKEKPARGEVVKVKEGLPINTQWLNKTIDRYLTEISDVDSLLVNPPLLIQNRLDLSKIDSVVNGPLLIDGSYSHFSWEDTISVIVRGDLQITGDVRISGINFIVAGEIKILDKANVNSNLFTPLRIFIGDYAIFEGSAFALKSIAVYGKAQVINKSTLLAGSVKKSSTEKASDSVKFSIFLSEESVIDGVCLAIGIPGSIKTDKECIIKGILWAQKMVCHRGRMEGLIVAERLVDCDDPLQMAAEIVTQDSSSAKKENKVSYGLVKEELFNSIPGEVEPLPSIKSYYLPWFIGRLSIVGWYE
ncbi:MAG: hypothetical protein N2053_04215 [Chitinispirillaceae bacterium]|nr:hypothetical protein [Chitinispirillaceae bacterium]